MTSSLHRCPACTRCRWADNVAYTDSTGRYFLFGHLYDMQDQVDLTEQRQAQGYRMRFPAAVLNYAIKTVRAATASACSPCSRTQTALTATSSSSSSRSSTT